MASSGEQPAHGVNHADFELRVHDLGRIPYGETFDLQRKLHAEVVASRNTDEPRSLHLLLLEHDPPVITVSKRKTAGENLVATPEQLAEHGVEVAETDRGGDITYHGPGQLVVYPIFDLNLLGLRLHGYMRMLEQIVIDTLAHFGIEGLRDPEATGVWVHIPTKAHVMHDVGLEHNSKICAMGVRVSRWVTMHGLALNVTTNLNHFDLIVPCGLAGRGVVSMQAVLGETCPAMDEVKTEIVKRFQRLIAESMCDS